MALDVALDHQTDPDGLIHSGLADDRAYLQPLKEKWLRGEELEHTSRQKPPPPHQLLIRHPTSGTTAGLHLPDLAGETFDAQFVTRSFPQEFINRLQETTGLLLFVHCGHNADHTLLEDPIFMDPIPTTETPPPVDPASEWSLEKSPRQVKLVELLQFIAQASPRQKPLRIAVMLSAWDIVEDAPLPAAAEMPKDPVRFLSVRWPLLDQYLRSHADTFRFSVFGVSARGGGTTPADIARLTALPPSERILVVDGAHRSHDLTRPVRWLLGMLDPTTSPDD